MAWFSPGSWIGDAVKGALTGPLIQGGVDAYKAKLASGDSHERITADLVGRELAVQQRELELQSEYKRSIIGAWYAPVNLFGYAMVFHLVKVIVWDNALGWGSTPDLKGNTAIWAGMIMTYWLGQRAFESVMRIIKR